MRPEISFGLSLKPPSSYRRGTFDMIRFIHLHLSRAVGSNLVKNFTPKFFRGLEKTEEIPIGKIFSSPRGSGGGFFSGRAAFSLPFLFFAQSKYDLSEYSSLSGEWRSLEAESYFREEGAGAHI